MATNFYVIGPGCTPSRSGFLTGRYPQRNGLFDMIRNDRAPGRAHEDALTPLQSRRQPEMTLGLDVREYLDLYPDRDPDDRYTEHMAAISSMDAQIGKIIDVLDEYGIADNTIINVARDISTSDAEQVIISCNLLHFRHRKDLQS